MPPFDILPLFSAGRSRRLTLVPIIQSLAQLEKNYGKEGSEIIQDNTQDLQAQMDVRCAAILEEIRQAGYDGKVVNGQDLDVFSV